MGARGGSWPSLAGSSLKPCLDPSISSPPRHRHREVAVHRNGYDPPALSGPRPGGGRGCDPAEPGPRRRPGHPMEARVLEIAKMAVDAARAAGAGVRCARRHRRERSRSPSATRRWRASTGRSRPASASGCWSTDREGSRPPRASTTRRSNETAGLAVEIARPAPPSRRSGLAHPGRAGSSIVAHPVKEDPFTVPLEEKVALLMESSAPDAACRGLSFAEPGSTSSWRSTWFASSRGRDRAGRHGLRAGSRRRRSATATCSAAATPTRSGAT